MKGLRVEGLSTLEYDVYCFSQRRQYILALVQFSCGSVSKHDKFIIYHL